MASILLLACPLLRAQQTGPSSGKPLPPEGPLIQKRAPDATTWTVIEGAAGSVKDRLRPPTGSTGKSNAGATTQKTIFVKSDDIVHVEVNLGEDQPWNVWIKGELQVVVWPDGKTIGLANKVAGSLAYNPLVFDFSKSDFAGFEWISADNYTGKGSAGGKTCLTFKATSKGSSNPAFGNGLSNDQIAYVDEETRLPVALMNKFGVKMYQFSPSPEPKFALPPEVQAFIDAQVRKRQMLARRPGVPY